jgi:opacity protein-like surface antigen
MFNSTQHANARGVSLRGKLFAGVGAVAVALTAWTTPGIAAVWLSSDAAQKLEDDLARGCREAGGSFPTALHQRPVSQSSYSSYIDYSSSAYLGLRSKWEKLPLCKETTHEGPRVYVATGVAFGDVDFKNQADGSAGGFDLTSPASTNRAFVQWAGITAGISESFYDFYGGSATQYRGSYLPDSGDPGWLIWDVNVTVPGGAAATVTSLPGGPFNTPIGTDQISVRENVEFHEGVGIRLNRPLMPYRSIITVTGGLAESESSVKFGCGTYCGDAPAIAPFTDSKSMWNFSPYVGAGVGLPVGSAFNLDFKYEHVFGLSQSVTLGNLATRLVEGNVSQSINRVMVGVDFPLQRLFWP